MAPKEPPLDPPLRSIGGPSGRLEIGKGTCTGPCGIVWYGGVPSTAALTPAAVAPLVDPQVSEVESSTYHRLCRVNHGWD